MSQAYNLDALRPLSLFSPDVRLQQVTVAVAPHQVDWIAQDHGRQAEVIFVLCSPRGEVLLVNKAVYPAGTYRLPTGGLQAGETPQEAAIREIYEETGYRVAEPRLLGVVDYTMHWTDQPGDAAFVSYVFTAEVDSAQAPSAVQMGEVDGYRWVPAQELDAVATHLRNLPQDWVYWGRFRAVSYEFIRCGIMQYNRDVSHRLVAGR